MCISWRAFCCCALFWTCTAVRQGGGVEYIMQPRIDRLSCQTFPLGGSAGPTAQAQRRRLLQASANAKLGMVSWACGI